MVLTSADRLVAHYIENHHNKNNADLVVTITYPSYGIGSVLTQVHLIVHVDDTPLVSYKILSGGLKERDMTLQITANITTYLNYDVRFYGL